jgi:pyridoxamine 5'-phosphate oxidase
VTCDGAFSDDPLRWFEHELSRAKEREVFDATRAALATVDSSLQPSVRFVLVKHVDARGFAFFTNLKSAKARALSHHPRAALAFHWSSIGVQIRVEGSIEALSASESDAYFATRARGSQLAAWASNQSEPVEARAVLEQQLERVIELFPDNTHVPRPPHWGGLRVKPSRIEIWHDGEDRMHDRWSFTRDANASWTCVRLQP